MLHIENTIVDISRHRDLDQNAERHEPQERNRNAYKTSIERERRTNQLLQESKLGHKKAQHRQGGMNNARHSSWASIEIGSLYRKNEKHE